jgi:hypothetical protein
MPTNSLVSVKSGFWSATLVAMSLAVAALPARAQPLVRGWGSLWLRIQKMAAGALIDLDSIFFVLAPTLMLLILAVAFLTPSSRRAGFQRTGVLLLVWPVGFLLWLLTLIAQEVKAERGNYPTLFDLSEGLGNASFVQGAIEFAVYPRIYLPALAGVVLSVAVIIFRHRIGRRKFDQASPSSLSSWSVGVLCGLTLNGLVLRVAVRTIDSLGSRMNAAGLGEPLTGFLESAWDLAKGQGPSSPRALVLNAEFSAEAINEGAGILGWPDASSVNAAPVFRRPWSSHDSDALSGRGHALLKSFETLSEQLFVADAQPLAVFFLSLEGFRADDLHALNSQAPVDVAPFVSSLYEKSKQSGLSGVLSSDHFYQGGVRTAHCVGAMTCGLGTLPYNLSFIRDLQPIPVRCTSDLLAEAGFSQHFLYGSDAKFDSMQDYFKAHGFKSVVDQKSFPKNAPKGTWGAVTDFAVFDEAVSQVASGLESGTSQFAFVMSLSNHSPFTEPADFPEELRMQVKKTLETNVNRGDADDFKRVMTYAYTDRAVQRLFLELSKRHIADRSVVVMMADHSTGHNYIWGASSDEGDRAKARIPLVMVIPKQLLATAHSPAALAAALDETQRALNVGPLSQNDIPSLLLALLSHHPSLQALTEAQRWHTMGGQLTSPHFKPPSGATLIGVNGVSEFYMLDEKENHVGDYEDAVFLKTRADRYRVTPTLIPAAATLKRVLESEP